MSKRVLGIVSLLLGLVLFVSCGTDIVSQRAKEYLSLIEQGEFEAAYSYLTPAMRENMNMDVFNDYMINPETNVSISDTGIHFDVYNSRVFRDGETASVYGLLTIDDQEQDFRLPMILDDEQWWVANVVAEQQSEDYKGFYITDKLRGESLDFFDWMLDANTEKLWDKSSKRIHEEYTIAEYKQLAIKTVSGKTPREEEYVIMIGPAFSTEPEYIDDDKTMKGFVFATIAIGDPETSEQKAIVKADFVFEENEWRADFAYLEPFDIEKHRKQLSE